MPVLKGLFSSSSAKATEGGVESSHLIPSLSLDTLWQRAEKAGMVRVWTHSNLSDTMITGYEVTLVCRRGTTKVEIAKRNNNLHFAFEEVLKDAVAFGLLE